MIIWRGMGILALLVAVAINVAINEAANGYFDAGARKDAQILVDKETGQDVHLAARHDLFFIPLRWWALVWLAAGLWLSLGR